MVFKKLCIRVHWTKVASALKGLNGLINSLINTIVGPGSI